MRKNVHLCEYCRSIHVDGRFFRVFELVFVKKKSATIVEMQMR